MSEIFKIFGTIAINGVDDAEQDINDLTNTAKKSEGKLISTFKKVGAAVAAAFTIDKIISFGQEIVSVAATVAAEESAFAQIMGDYADEATEKLASVAEATGKVDTSLTPYMTSITAKFKGLGFGIEDATDLAVRGLTLASDASAFWDMSLDESVSHLNSFINGSYEGGEAIGLFANDTQLAMYAVEQGIVSSKTEWAALDEATKQATRLEYAENMMKLSGATGQASKESKQYANVQANLTEKWRQFQAQIGEPILQNIVTPAMIKLCDVIDALSSGYENATQWVSENGDKIQEWTNYLAAASVGIATFLLYLNWGSIMTAAANALKTVTVAIQALNAAIKKNLIAIIISAIIALITYLVLLYNTNDEFRAFVDDMLTKLLPKIQKVIGWIKANVLPVIKEIANWVKANVLPLVREIVEWFTQDALPVIKEFIGWIAENVLPTLVEIVEWLVQNVLPVIAEIAGWLLETLLPALKEVLSWIGEHIIAVVAPVIEWLLSTIGGFFSWLSEIFSGGSDTIGGVWETIKGFFKSAWDFIVSVWEACQPFFNGIWEGIILPVWGLIQEMIGAFQMAWDVIKLAWGYVQPYFAAIWEGIKLAVSVLWTFLSTGFQNAWEIIKLVWGVVSSWFGAVWESIKAIFSVVATYLGGFFRTAWEVIKTIWNVAISFFTLVWAGIKAVFAVVKGVLSGDFSDAWEAIKNVWNKAKAFFRSVWDGIKNIFGAVKSWFSNTFSAAWEAVKRVFSTWGSFFSGLWDKITNTFSKIGTNIADAIGSAVKAGINGVLSMIEGTINTGINLINGAINLINNIPGVNIGAIGKLSLPRLAKGGVIDRPTVAEIGEDGAEAVVPLERNTQWIDKVANRLNTNRGDDDEDDERIIAKLDELIEAIRNLKIWLNGNVLVGELVGDIDAGLGELNSLRKRGS